MPYSPSMRIFILGCGSMQIPALRIARELGWYVAAADGNSEAVGCGLCDEFFHVDLKDTDALIEAASGMAGGAGPDGVFTAGTDFSYSVATVAATLGLPGHSQEAALRATDKVLMRRVFRDADVPSPPFVEVGPNDDACAVADDIPGPWVVKPVDSMGARGVVRIDHSADLADALDVARGYSRSGRALLESFMEGPEFSLDALVEDGSIIRCGLADRHIVFPPYFIEIGHTIPSKVNNEIAENLWDVFGRGIEALGLTHGSAKGDVKLTPSGPMIGEIAGRLSGGYMSGWTWPYASGIESTRGALRLAVGLPADLTEPETGTVCAERALIGIDGTVRTLDGIERALHISGVKNVFLRYKSGEKLVFPRNNVEKAGNVIAVAADRETADERARAALRALRLELDPKDDATGVYLDGSGPFPPDVYDVGDAFSCLWKRHPPKPSRGCPVTVPEIHLPSDVSQVTDYTGLMMSEAVTILASEGLIKMTSNDFSGEMDRKNEKNAGDSVLSDFFKALVRGGLPGARWYLERLQ